MENALSLPPLAPVEPVEPVEPEKTLPEECKAGELPPNGTEEPNALPPVAPKLEALFPNAGVFSLLPKEEEDEGVPKTDGDFALKEAEEDGAAPKLKAVELEEAPGAEEVANGEAAGVLG